MMVSKTGYSMGSLFTTVSGEGQPQSYFVYFLITLAAFFIGEYFWKKKAKTAN
jgi:signal peptidase I